MAADKVNGLLWDGAKYVESHFEAFGMVFVQLRINSGRIRPVLRLCKLPASQNSSSIYEHYVLELKGWGE
jgi:hypothetical protein